jgi:hypothetical protein
LQGTKETEHCTVIYSGVDGHIRGQSGVMIWIHKIISNKINNNNKPMIIKNKRALVEIAISGESNMIKKEVENV